MARNQAARQALSQSNFYYSFLFLPKKERDAIYQVYRFCRAVDDVVDGTQPREEKKRQIQQWRQELDRCYAGQPGRPITQSLLKPIRAFGLSRVYFEELLRGVERDIHTTRYETFNDLSEYCYDVAGTVGQLCLQIFGVSLQRYRDYAVSLGTAFQLTNILRDLKTDAARGRIYLPLEDLRKFGYTEKDLLACVYNDNFIALMQYEYDRARRFYQQAHALLLPQDRKRLVASEIMSAIYSTLLKRIQDVHYDIFTHSITLSVYQKLLIALRTRIGISRPVPART
jgi:15-cis-phytoene synthase